MNFTILIKWAHNQRPFKLGVLCLSSLLLFNCAAPRSVIHNGRVTSKGDFQIGFNQSANLGTAILSQLTESKKQLIEAIVKQDSIKIDSITDPAKLLMAHSLDPLGMASDIYIRYGIYKRTELGYHYVGGSHQFDLYYQILDQGSWPFCIGIQYSSADYELPSVLGKLQNLLGYSMSRKDFLLPLITQKDFGDSAKYGGVSFGAALGYSKISYKFEPVGLYSLASDKANSKPLSAIPEQESSFLSYGIFANLRAGYKYVFIMPSLSVFYQNYGSYKFFEGRNIDLSGWTFIPGLGFEVKF